MAWSKVAEATVTINDDTGQGNQTVSLSGSESEDDVVIVVWGADIVGNSIQSSGWTQDTSGGSLPSVFVGYKVMGATPDSSFDIKMLQFDEQALLWQTWSGGDPTSILDAAIQRDNGFSGQIDPPSLTTSNDGALRVIGGSLDQDNFTPSAPSGFSNLQYLRITNGVVTTVMCSKEEATAGALNPGTITGGSENDGWKSFHISFAPSTGTAYTLTAAAGSFTISGTAANLEYGREVVGGAGSYTLTGQDATLQKTLPLTAEAGSYSLSGSDVSPLLGRLLTADAGSIVLTGTDATLQKTLPLTAETGSYALSGVDASVLRGFSLSAEAGAFSISGTDAALEFGYSLVAGAGAFTLNGQDVTLTYQPTLGYSFGVIIG